MLEGARRNLRKTRLRKIVAELIHEHLYGDAETGGSADLTCLKRNSRPYREALQRVTSGRKR